MAYDEENFDEAMGWFVLVAVLAIMLVLGFGAWLVLGPGRIEHRDVRQANAEKGVIALHYVGASTDEQMPKPQNRIETYPAPSDPPPCTKDSAKDRYRVGDISVDAEGHVCQEASRAH